MKLSETELAAVSWRLGFLDLMMFMHERPHGDWRTRCMIVHGDRLNVVGVLPPRRQRRIDVRIYANNNRVKVAFDHLATGCNPG